LYWFDWLSAYGLKNKEKNSVLSMYFIGQRQGFSMFCFNLIVYDYTYLFFFLKLLLKKNNKREKIVILCTDSYKLFLVQSVMQRYGFNFVSSFSWYNGLLTSPLSSFWSQQVVYFSNSKRRSRVLPENTKLIKLIVSVGYSLNLVLEAKRLNLPVLGFTNANAVIAQDYMLFGNSESFQSIYLNCTLLGSLLQDVYRK